MSNESLIKFKTALRVCSSICVFAFCVFAGLIFCYLISPALAGVGLVQILLIIIVTWGFQYRRKESLAAVTGRCDVNSISFAVLGASIGIVLMAVPAVILSSSDWIEFQWAGASVAVVIAGLGVAISTAVMEELLFRGYIFQRIRNDIGVYHALIITSMSFAVLHLAGSEMVGIVLVFAFVNIFLTSILLGLGLIWSKGLLLPIFIHAAANFMQGTILGFSVSGNEKVGIFQPISHQAPIWLTGGSFGLEASFPGMISVCGILVLFVYNSKGLPVQVTRMLTLFRKKTQ